MVGLCDLNCNASRITDSGAGGNQTGGAIDSVAVMQTLMRTVFVIALGLLMLSGCGSADSEGAAESQKELSVEAAAGREVALSRGCAACHGDNGEGGVGPTWIGLAGRTVELEGGGAVVADTDYLRRSILDPQADTVAGTTLAMPVSDLTDDEVAALIAYIEELG